jgi:hypothetical protein
MGMIKIDWTEFVRRHIWFGWQCVAIHDGVGQWRLTGQWKYRIVPVAKRDWEIDSYKKNETLSGPGIEVWDPIIK